MSLDPNRVLTDYDVWAMAALDTVPLLADRIGGMLSHGRRITLVKRYVGRDDTPTVKVGLTVEEIKKWKDDSGFGVNLAPGLEGFGFSSDEATESEVRRRFNRGDRKDITEVKIHGGAHGPGRGDHIVIRHWNVYGVGEETVVAFDLGDVDL